MAYHTFFDVGANNGEWGLARARSEPNCRVFGFEPTPELCDTIRKGAVGLSNYILTQAAVSDVPGKSMFHVSPQQDWGCSSLLNFKSREIIEKTWPGRPDIDHKYSIEVDCIRLDNFCRLNEIVRVDYIHCDAQGMDLRVLQSFGDMITNVMAGEIETASSTDSAIYSNQDSTVDKCVSWLTSKGFFIRGIVSNDPQTNEVVVHFSR